MESACWASSDNSYNDNKIRFPAPVPGDARVRGRAEVVSIEDKWMQHRECRLERRVKNLEG